MILQSSILDFKIITFNLSKPLFIEFDSIDTLTPFGAEALRSISAHLRQNVSLSSVVHSCHQYFSISTCSHCLQTFKCPFLQSLLTVLNLKSLLSSEFVILNKMYFDSKFSSHLQKYAPNSSELHFMNC